MKRKWVIYCTAALLSCMSFCIFVSCRKDQPLQPQREGPKRVFVLYADGYNNLPSYMRSNISDLQTNLPVRGATNYRVLAYTHFTDEAYDYNTPTQSHLIEMSKDEFGRVVNDTLCTYPSSMISSSAEGIRAVLEDVQKLFPDHEYGMVYSSHGTGWLPEEYYDNFEDSWSFSESGDRPSSYRRNLFCLPDTKSLPQTKSLGCQAYYTSQKVLHTHEIELQDLSDAFAVKLKYLVLDACLMGGIETAYQLRSCAENIAFSQTEVLAQGYNYKTMLSRLLFYTTSSPDLENLCKDMSSDASSYTVSAIDCSGLENIASVCKNLFEKYRSEIAAAKASDIQGFFRYGKHFFYDLRDMLDKAGISPEDMASLDEALEGCVKCCYFSDEFLGLKISNDCGFSTYLPSKGNATLDTFYKNLDWNKATSFVE